MAKHRTHSIEFKRQVVQEFLGGESPHALAKRQARWAQREEIETMTSFVVTIALA